MRTLLTLALLAPLASADDAFFEQRIRPLLAEKCQSCHGGTKARGGLKLDAREAVLQGGETGPAAISGDAAKSLLIAAVKQTGELKMPPKGKLTSQEIADLEAWVNRKLPWPATAPVKAKELWALKPLAKPALPPVKRPAWPADPLDRFILAGIESHGLAPAKPAAPRTLMRRVAFDLTGLPPHPIDVERFAADPSPTAYRAYVEKLLASPTYGERWGRHWLDLVRYCDSFDSRGIGGDGDCADAWRYRDWVVRSLNADMPYSRFVQLQIAGDLLEPGPEGLIPTGMLALGNWGGGDADKEKLLTDIVDDQVDVVSRSILGLTVACARCHDHKFDPISTKDYYALGGIFFSSHILPNVGAKTGGPNMLRVNVETAAELAQRREREAASKACDAATARTLTEARKRALERIRAELPRHLLPKPGDQLDERLTAFARTMARPAAGVPFAKRRTIYPGMVAWAGPTDNPALILNVTPDAIQYATIVAPGHAISVHPGPKSDVAVVWTSPVSGDVSPSGELRDFDPTCGDGVDWELRLAAGNGVKSLAKGTLANGGKQALPSPTVHVEAGDRLELVINRRAGYECDTTGIGFAIRSESQSWNLATDFLKAMPEAAQVGPWSAVEVTSATPWTPAVQAAIAKWQAAKDEASAKALAEALANAGTLPTSLEGLFAPAEQATLARLRAESAAIKAKLDAPRPTAHATQEGGVPDSPHAGTHDVKVHIRGRYDRLGDPAPRGFPAAVTVANAPKIVAGSGRKELADWLTRPDHPLTARVIVNRVWQYHFGEGLVRTPSNFGTLGEAPSHPELLDFLAAKFVAEGWSLKTLHRQILLSSTYRQAAATNADADNRWLARFPRKRLEAEAIRDSLLTVAGKLDAARGGPSVRDFGSPRRTLYVTSIRSDRTGFSPLFDAADNTAPVDKRTLSTVAPQALFLMNHPFVKAQAEAFAARLDEPEPLVQAHRLAFARKPSDNELSLGRAFLASGGTLAEWCHLLLQSNEFVTLD